jgi:site-specific DNA-cytosine methylase
MREFPWLVAGGSAGKNLPIRGADEPSFTIKAGNETHRILCEDGTAARLNGRHLARLMGVADGFRLPKSNTRARTVLGNGLPPRLLDALAGPMVAASSTYRVPMLDLFSGAGVGTSGIGYLARKVGAVEFDAKIAEVHRLNYPDTELVVAPVQDVDMSRWSGIEWLHASPVCKRFSVAKSGGTRLKDGTRVRHEAAGEQEVDIITARATAAALLELGPRFFTLENVPAYETSEAFALILEAVKLAGMHYHYAVYDAVDYGTPQNRSRLILRASYEAIPVVLPTWGKPSGWWPALSGTEGLLTPTKLADWQWPRILPETAPWATCPLCEDGWCEACEDHVADCDCPPIEVWNAAGRNPWNGNRPQTIGDCQPGDSLTWGRY